MDEEKKRYKNSLDTFSLQENDWVTPSAEEIAEGEAGFMEVLASLATDKQRFIALALYHGFNKTEISHILHVSLSDIVHLTRSMQMRLAIYRIRYKRK